MVFLNRLEAGRMLAVALEGYRGQSSVVYALPRGGVVLGVEVARALTAPLDLIVVRKIGHPQQPEYAVAAIAEGGYIVANPQEMASLDRRWFDHAAAEQLNEARRRRRVFLDGRSSVPVAGRTAIVVDDGLATGLTMKAAIHEIRRRGPNRLVVAVPVAAAETADNLRPLVDDLVVLHVSFNLEAIGNFYADFEQVTDEEVVALMKSTDADKSHLGTRP
jgi:predicted phosphoribosyltransferase